MIQLLMMLILFLSSGSLWAENPLYCMDSSEIKQTNPKNIHLFSTGTDREVDDKTKSEFIHTVSNFQGAAWSDEFHYENGRCYYTSSLEAEVFLAHWASDLKPSGPNWISYGVFTQCSSSNLIDCNFAAQS